MRSFYFAVELWRAALDVGIADAKILDVPVELGLELMAVVRSDFFDAERKLFDDVIDKVDRVDLGMSFINLECANPCCVISCGVLKAAHLLTHFTNESQELNVHLNVVTRDLFVVAFGMDFAQPGSTRKPINAVAFEYPGNSGIG